MTPTVWPFRKLEPISSMSAALPRSELLRRARIAILDDERPEMLQDLKDQGLAVDYLASTSDPNFQRLGQAFYDILLLDYGGIGISFGRDEGLDVLKFVKRVNPSLRVLAFTARTFDASKADFFRSSDGVLTKDAGIRETLEQLESHLAEVMTAMHQFNGLKAALDLSPDQAATLERALSKAITKNGDKAKPLSVAKKFAKGASTTLVETLVTKAIELGVAHLALLI